MFLFPLKKENVDSRHHPSITALQTNKYFIIFSLQFHSLIPLFKLCDRQHKSGLGNISLLGKER